MHPFFILTFDGLDDVNFLPEEVNSMGSAYIELLHASRVLQLERLTYFLLNYLHKKITMDSALVLAAASYLKKVTYTTLTPTPTPTPHHTTDNLIVE